MKRVKHKTFIVVGSKLSFTLGHGEASLYIAKAKTIKKTLKNMTLKYVGRVSAVNHSTNGSRTLKTVNLPADALPLL